MIIELKNSIKHTHNGNDIDLIALKLTINPASEKDLVRSAKVNGYIGDCIKSVTAMSSIKSLSKEEQQQLKEENQNDTVERGQKFKMCQMGGDAYYLLVKELRQMALSNLKFEYNDDYYSINDKILEKIDYKDFMSILGDIVDFLQDTEAT